MSSNPNYVRCRTERGSALFLAIFALAAIGFVSLKLVSRTKAYSQLLQIHKDGLAHHAALRGSLKPLFAEQRGCELQHLTGRSIARVDAQGSQWYVCTTGQPIFLSNNYLHHPPISPDYQAIFDRSTPCHFLRSMIILRVFDTPMAPFTCILPQVIQGDSIILDNISADSTIVSPSSPAGTTTIATPGSLIVTASLSIPGDTLIVAGGHVKISTLQLLQSPGVAPTAAVTVLSAHGDIVIERIQGKLSLLALGRRSIAVPPTSTPNSPLLPPARVISISGFGPRT